MSLQAVGKIAFEDIPVFGVCCPACHDSSLYLFDLVECIKPIVLSQVHVALKHFQSAHCSRLNMSTFFLFILYLCHIYPGVPHQCAALFSLYKI